MIFNKVIEIWRAPLVSDAYGQHRDWDHAVRLAPVPASVQPFTADELITDRETTVTRLKVYLRRMDIQSTDRVLIDGAWWELDGEPADWSYPLPTRHMRLILRRVAR